VTENKSEVYEVVISNRFQYIYLGENDNYVLTFAEKMYAYISSRGRVH